MAPALSPTPLSSSSSVNYRNLVQPAVVASPSPLYTATATTTTTTIRRTRYEYTYQQSPPNITPVKVYRGPDSPTDISTSPITPQLVADFSAMKMQSPTALAARDYYRDFNTTSSPAPSIDIACTSRSRQPSALRTLEQNVGAIYPRRHSVALLDPNIYEQMANWKLRSAPSSRRGSAGSEHEHESGEQDGKEQVVYHHHRTHNYNTRFQAARKRLGELKLGQAKETELEEPEGHRENGESVESNTPSLDSSTFGAAPYSSTYSAGFTDYNISQAQQATQILEDSKIHNPLDPRYLGNIPFSYTTKKLQEWGDVYLGNSATADAFIRAIPISSSPTTSTSSCSSFSNSNSSPGPSTTSLKSPPSVLPTTKLNYHHHHHHPTPPTKPTSPSLSNLVRVKIIPRSRTRKCFSMQKSFPAHTLLQTNTNNHNRNHNHNSEKNNNKNTHHYRIDKPLPSSSSSSSSSVHTGTTHKPKSEILRNRMLSTSSTTTTAAAQVSTPLSQPNRDNSTRTPIHIEYALYRTPLLGAILLSGHVFCGDTVELPVPNPHAWLEVVEWIYTGRKDISEEARIAVEYLGGRVS